jgi:phosphopantothenoylcysteine decarboxylase/phosphopantothenate--cysteine ligase
MTERRILLLMSGSIACAKATGLVSAWVKTGHDVRVACTPSVAEFVGPATLEGLSGQPVFDDTFARGSAMEHIRLAQWADWLVVCPATSNLINKLAAGIADDAVTTLWQAAWGRPAQRFIVPAMNTRMWQYPATQASVVTLRNWGVQVLPTASGELACGEQGEGRMLEVDEVLAQLEAAAVVPSARPRRVLVTGGGTREPIDAVRYIGNHSSGRTAATLVERLAAAGHEVTWLGARDAQRPQCTASQELYSSFDERDRQLQRVLGGSSWDLVVHAAAVSDFSVAELEAAAANGKLASGQPLELRLQPNPKLLARLHGYSANPDLQVVAFKLTVGASGEEVNRAVQSVFAHEAVTAVVHNDLAHINDTQHAFSLFHSGGRREQLPDSTALAGALAALIEGAP